MNDKSIKNVKCPECGYRMPIEYIKGKSKCEKVFVRCKGRGCKKKFEIKI